MAKDLEQFLSDLSRITEGTTTYALSQKIAAADPSISAEAAQMALYNWQKGRRLKTIATMIRYLEILGWELRIIRKNLDHRKVGD